MTETTKPAVPTDAIAIKWADPIEDVRWLYDEDQVDAIEKEDPSLVCRVEDLTREELLRLVNQDGPMLKYFLLDTDTNGSDEILFGSNRKDALGDVLHHHEITELPSDWSLDEISGDTAVYCAEKHCARSRGHIEFAWSERRGLVEHYEHDDEAHYAAVESASLPEGAEHRPV